MDYSTLSDPLKPGQDLESIDAFSIYQAFEQVQDGRQKRGVRYSVALVLTLLMLSKLAGMTTLAAGAHWVRLRAPSLSRVLPVKRKEFPCAATYSNVLRVVDEEQVLQVMAHLLTRLRAARRCGMEPSRLLSQPEAREQHAHVALDGKTLRGTCGHLASDQPSVHLVALYETQTGVVLAQHAVPTKGNEISLESVLLTPTAVHGRIVTADAMHTQRTCCADITRFGGHYVFLAKGNQATLEEDLCLFFSEPPLDCRDWRQASTCTKGHGRLEQRVLVASTELNEFLADRWPGIGQVFRLERTVQEHGRVRQETICGITSLPPCQASALRLLHLVRAHWAIENRLHWRRDVTLREDHCQVRKGNAPQVLAALNNVVLSVLDFLEVPNVPEQMRIFDADPQRAVRLLLGSLLTFK
jgi:predicted transposase YbfD/YdcC